MSELEWYENIYSKLKNDSDLDDNELSTLIAGDLPDNSLFELADSVRRRVYGNKIYVRGLIEFSNYCKNDCYYCGIRKSNLSASRYRLSKDEILFCCDKGYELGYRTFVLQSGEDLYFDDKRICEIVYAIRCRFPDCAITLSLGEKSKSSYKAYFSSGANRYLLRHETADENHYSKLHPESMSLLNRKRCLWDLKETGYQVGAGFMVGSPYQTVGNIVSDIRFLQELDPDMVGIGPFIPHPQTPFANFDGGNVYLTVKLLAITRILLPRVLLPATTALATALPNGRELGLRAGANVLMPNLSPENVRNKYDLYENKASSGMEDAAYLTKLKNEVQKYGYEIVSDIGNVKKQP